MQRVRNRIAKPHDIRRPVFVKVVHHYRSGEVSDTYDLERAEGAVSIAECNRLCWHSENTCGLDNKGEIQFLITVEVSNSTRPSRPTKAGFHCRLEAAVALA